MKRLLSGVIILGLFFSPQFAYAQAEGQTESPVYRALRFVLPSKNLEMAGFIKNETAVRANQHHTDIMKLENTIQLEMRYKLANWLYWFGNFRFFYDSAYDITSRFQKACFEDVGSELRMPIKQQWLREIYLDFLFDRFDARIGRQQVVWGTADGVRILDRINPIDMREWTLDNYVDARIPLYMLKMEGKLFMNERLQVLFIPDFEANYYAPNGAPFTLRTVRLGDEAMKRLQQARITTNTIDQKPGRKFKDAQIGVRWSDIIFGIDYTLNYYHQYNFASSAYTAMDFRIIPGRGPIPVAFNLTRRAEQVDTFGFSYSRTITEDIPFLQGWTLRGEFAYIKGDAFNYGTDENIVGTVDVNQYNYVLGFDKNFWTNWIFSFQFIQFITHPAEKYVRANDNVLLMGPTRGPLDRYENSFSIKISTDFWNDRLKPECLVIYGDDNDWKISPKVSFELNDNINLALGLHIFEGPDWGLNGQFDKNDEVYLETRYSW
jgi:hypothetical protein